MFEQTDPQTDPLRMSRQLQNKCRGVIWHIPVSTRQMPVQEGSSDTDKKLCSSRGIQDEGVSSPVLSVFFADLEVGKSLTAVCKEWSQ